MRTLNAKSFWTYGAVGLVGGLLYLLIARLWISDYAKRPNPTYADYLSQKKAYDAWEKGNADLIKRRQFEEVLAGRQSADSVERSELQEIAVSLAVLKEGAAADPKKWSKALADLFFSAKRDPRISKWTVCAVDGNDRARLYDCRFIGELDALNDPIRLAGILAGDGKNLTEVPAPPQGLEAAPEFPAGTPKYLAAPSWLPWLKWIVLSVLFALCFCLAGLVARSENEPGWGHPFRGWPNFILGWMVMLALAPGFLATRLLYLLAIDVTPAIDRVIRPGLRRFAGLFVRKPTFADEYEEFSAQLSEMNKTASAAGNRELLKEIEEISVKVRQAQDSKKLAKLKSSLANMRSYIQLTSELEQGF